jgi:hypothetical protein
MSLYTAGVCKQYFLSLREDHKQTLKKYQRETLGPAKVNALQKNPGITVSAPPYGIFHFVRKFPTTVKRSRNVQQIFLVYDRKCVKYGIS